MLSGLGMSSEARDMYQDNFKLSLCFYVQRCRKGMDQELKYYIKTMKRVMLRKDFKVFKTQLWSWSAGTKLMKIRGSQKCKIHSCSLKGFRITACQSWCIFRPRVSWPLLDAGISYCHCFLPCSSSNSKCPRQAEVNLRGPKNTPNSTSCNSETL